MELDLGLWLGVSGLLMRSWVGLDSAATQEVGEAEALQMRENINFALRDLESMFRR